jgi:fumarate hydratase class I
VVIDAVQKAQGLGCAPGSLGIAIGGDRGSSYLLSKQQFLRSLDDRNPDRELAALEKRLLAEINELGIGPMGFGGKTTVLTVKIGKMHRLPASFFVSISYMCWAFRRARMTIRGEKVTYGY